MAIVWDIASLLEQFPQTETPQVYPFYLSIPTITINRQQFFY